MKLLNYKKIVSHYEGCFEKFGDTNLGVDWPNIEDTFTRHSVMLDVINFIETNEEVKLLDFGCGAGHFYDFIIQNNRTNINYSGLDLSPKYISHCKKKYPGVDFYLKDVLVEPLENKFDVIILNGVFTEKREFSNSEMFEYFIELLKVLFKHTNQALCFNVMSKNVDWEREDLFHLSLDKLTKHIKLHFGNKYIIRNDYGLYEYTVYILK